MSEKSILYYENCLIIAITLKNMNTFTNAVVFVEISTTIIYTNAEYVYIFKLTSFKSGTNMGTNPKTFLSFFVVEYIIL